MCGIAGVISRDRQAVELAIATMIRAQQHRGPDDAGSAFFDASRTRVGMGHRRLSILDLSPQGHQPMTHPESGGTLVFNGEIYNHADLRRELEQAGVRFRGHCDTEVLLHLLARDGVNAIDRLAGMYAFAYYDPRRQTLLLARDPLGIKPLYIHHTDESLIFASEVRGLLASGMVKPEVDRAGVASIMAYGAPQEPLTIIKDVRMFPAGHWQQIEVNDLGSHVSRQRHPHWRFPKSQRISSADAIRGTQEAIEASVRDHLMADVPVGVFLSSGLDSTIIASLAAKHASELRTFTVGFADEPDMSEAPLAAETARLLGVRHTTLNIQGPDALAGVQQWLMHLDQPSMDGLNVFLICQAVREAGIKVVLSGQGGDELYGGYPSFSDIPRLRKMMRVLGWLPRGMRLAAARALTMSKSHAVQQKMLDITSSDGSLWALYLQRRRAMSNRQIESLGFDPEEMGLTSDFQPREALERIDLDGADPVWSISQLETRIYQQNVLLRDSDANSMAHSLELRVPFLDRRVIDFVYSIPGDIRLPDGIANKHLLRAAFENHLRPELLQQAKRGFHLPIGRWLVGPLREMAEVGLDRLKQTGVVDEAGVDAIWTSFLAQPTSPLWSRAWTLCVVGVYLENLQKLAPAPPLSVSSEAAVPVLAAAEAHQNAGVPDRPQPENKVNIAIISNVPAPYRLHVLKRVSREIPEVKLHSLFTHSVASSGMPWDMKLDAEIKPITFGNASLVPNDAISWRARRLYRLIREYLEQNKIRMVVLHGYNDLTRASLIRWAKRASVPLLPTGDSNVFAEGRLGAPKRFVKRIYLRWLLNRAAGLMPMGTAGRAFFRLYAEHRLPTFLFPCEPDYEALQRRDEAKAAAFRRSHGLNEGRRRLVYSGRLVAVKGVDVLLDAFAKIADQRTEWDLVIVGDGELRSPLEARVPASLRSRVKWLGFLQFDQTIQCYHSCDVLVLPSDFEPWALVINEAVASGLAVVATEVVGAAVELVRHQTNGLIVPPRQVGAMAGALLDITQPERCAAMRAAAPEVLAQWRLAADPVDGVRQAMRHFGLIAGENGENVPLRGDR